MSNNNKLAYEAPTLTDYGNVEEITSTKTWYAATDWLGEIVDYMSTNDNGFSS